MRNLSRNSSAPVFDCFAVTLIIAASGQRVKRFLQNVLKYGF